MFNKRRIKTVDVLQGIVEQHDVDQPIEKIEKKVKQQEVVVTPEIPTFEEPRFKAKHTLQIKTQETETLEYRATANPVAETIQRLRSVNGIDDVKKGSVLPPKKTGLSAPIRMPANYKFTCHFDYNPSLCKDYHDTGYCTFGDSCIYIHDRGDYKAGWEQEKEWADEQKRRFQTHDDGNNELQEKLDEMPIPVECSICNLQLTNPVRTKCEHYFCEKCIINKKKCPQCNRTTDGIFQSAAKFIEEIKQQRVKLVKDFKPQEKQKVKFALHESDWGL